MNVITFLRERLWNFSPSLSKGTCRCIDRWGFWSSLCLYITLIGLHPLVSWAKVMFLQASVILSTAGSPAGRTPLARRPPSRETPLGADTPWYQTPWEQTPPQEQKPLGADPLGSRLQHMVNERPIRILLECILVWSCISGHSVTSTSPVILQIFSD